MIPERRSKLQVKMMNNNKKGKYIDKIKHIL